MRRVAAFLAASAAAVASAAIEVLPPDPVAGETFVVVDSLHATSGLSDCGAIAVSSVVEGRYVTLMQPAAFEPASWCRLGAIVDGLPEGPYTVRYRLFNSAFPYGQTPAVEAPLSVRSGNPAVPSYLELDGNWFNPAQPGWGVNLVQGQSGALFAVLLTYEPQQDTTQGGKGWWLVMSAGRWISPTQFRGPLYYVRGTPMDLPWQSPLLKLIPAGYLSLTFTGTDEARLDARYLSMRQGVWAQVSTTVRRFEF